MNNNFLVTVLRKFKNKKIVKHNFLRIKRFILNMNVMVIRVTEFIKGK